MEEEHKIYFYWKKVQIWVREDFMAANDEEAINLVKEGDYEVNDIEWADDWVELPYNYEERTATEELYQQGSDGKMIWDNTPIEIIREKKLKDILSNESSGETPS